MKHYGHLRRENGAWVLCEIPPHVAILLKQIFPRLPKTSTGPFTLPDNEFHCADLSWFLQRYPMAMTAADQRALRGGAARFRRNQAALERILAEDYAPTALAGLKPGQQVRLYQHQAVDMVLHRRGLLVGDDVGLGKTYTAAALLLDPRTRPAAVVMQAHLQGQWEEKLTAFTNLTVHAITGTKPYRLPPADVYLFRYTQVAGWVDHIATGVFKTAVFDEIQELRTGTDSQRGKACLTLAQRAEYRLGLSATPIYNMGSEIWDILQYIDDRVLGSEEDFAREYLSGRVVNNPEALGTYLRDQHVFLRRRKADVGQQMPQVNRLVEVIPSDESHLRSIDAIARELAERTIVGSFTERGMAARELDLRVRHATGVAKARHVAAYCRILLESGMPIVLAGWHREVYEIWLRELADFRPVMYTGSESPRAKRDSVNGFLEGRTNLFIISLRSGAGLDGLQHRCSTVVAGELDWSPKVHDQLIGRLDREGQTEQVTAIFLNSADGSDPPMVDLLGLKASQSTGIVDPSIDLGPIVADDTRVRALARRYLSQRDIERAEVRAREQLREEQLPLPGLAEVA